MRTCYECSKKFAKLGLCLVQEFHRKLGLDLMRLIPQIDLARTPSTNPEQCRFFASSSDRKEAPPDSFSVAP